METLQIKVERDLSGWDKPWMAYSEQLGGIDYSCEDGESWSNCGSPQGKGNTIQEAIEDFLDNLGEEITKYTWI